MPRSADKFNNWRDDQARINEMGIFNVTHDRVPRIRLWPLWCDGRSGVLIGAGGTRRSDWPARVLANDVSARIDRWPACEERSIAREQGQAAALTDRSGLLIDRWDVAV